MTPQDDPNAAPAPAAAMPDSVPAPPPVAVAPAAAALATLEGGLERVARELLRQQRTDRRWRMFFRLAWLGLAVAVAWALFAQRTHTPTSTKPHTALVEVRGEIAADNEASAELLVSALKSAFEDTGASPWCCASTRPAAARCRAASSTTRSAA
jgi:protease-4